MECPARCGRSGTLQPFRSAYNRPCCELMYKCAGVLYRIQGMAMGVPKTHARRNGLPAAWSACNHGVSYGCSKFLGLHAPPLPFSMLSHMPLRAAITSSIVARRALLSPRPFYCQPACHSGLLTPFFSQRPFFPSLRCVSGVMG